MSEVIQAAKRLRANEYGATGNYRQALYDAEDVARAALAAGMFAEDGEAVTEEWLRSIGFEKGNPDAKLAYAVPSDKGFTLQITPCDESVALIAGAEFTRSQVRTLLAALGVKGGA